MRIVEAGGFQWFSATSSSASSLAAPAASATTTTTSCPTSRAGRAHWRTARFCRLLQNNTISGPTPGSIGRLGMLQTLDISNNQLTGTRSIPSSLGDLKDLNYLKLNNNSLSEVLPDSLASINGLALIDLSFNNLSGPLPKISVRTFNIAGNPMICSVKSGNNCSSVSLHPLSYPPDDLKTQPQQAMLRSHRIAMICGATVGSIAFVCVAVSIVLWW